MQNVTPGATHGRYCIGTHELTSGDVIEWAAFDGARIRGRVEHDNYRYIVLYGHGRHVPLAELVEAAYVGSGRL